MVFFWVFFIHACENLPLFCFCFVISTIIYGIVIIEIVCKNISNVRSRLCVCRLCVLGL